MFFKKTKAKLQTRIKDNKVEIYIGGVCVLVGLAYIHGAKKSDYAKRIEAYLEQMEAGVSYLAQAKMEELRQLDNMRDLANDLINTDREFDWMPPLGMRIRPEGWVQKVKVMHLPSMSPN